MTAAISTSVDLVDTDVATPAPRPAAASGADIDELVRGHLPLVGHIVREVLTRVPAHINRNDLVSAGMLALVLAARSYDADRGVPFGRFAAIRIRGALTDELRTMDWASRAVRGKARELESVRNDLAAALGRTPTREETAQAMGVAVSALDTVDADVQRAAVLSLQALTTDEGVELLPTTTEGPEALLLKREQIGYLHDAIAELPERLHTVVQRYFFENRKMAEIAEELGVTESRVSQLRGEALAMLRQGMSSVDEAPHEAPRARGRGAVRQAYCAAVASRSSVAARLDVTNALGEVRRLHADV
jgi:RNA polymerase sigma factor for flagellar operon FliA